MSMVADDSSLVIRTSRESVDFRGGVRQRVNVDPDDPHRSVLLRTVGFRAAAALPGGGTMVIEQDEPGESGTLTVTQQSPTRYEHVIKLPVTMTIEWPGQEPLVRVSRELMTLIGRISHFPPRGAVYQL